MMAQQKSDLEKYFIIKKDIDLPVKVRLYFLIFENVLDQTKTLRTIQSRKGFSKQLVNAFTNLSLSQKGYYLLSNINFVADQLDRQQKQKTKSDSKIQTDQVQHVETTCQMLLTALKISYWTTVSLKLDKLKKILSVTNKKKSFTIDMKNYFVRRSKKYKNSIVVEVITEQMNNEAKKYIFSFTTYIVSKIYQQMLKCCLQCQHEKILSMLIGEQEEEKDEKNQHSHQQTNEKALVFLNSKNINDYLAYKQKVEKQIMQNKFEFKTIFPSNLHLNMNINTNNLKIKIEQSLKIDKVFRMQTIFEVDSKQLRQKFLYSFHNKNKFVRQSQILQNFSKKYQAVYQKLTVKSKIYEYISIQQQSSNTNQEQILFVKGVENIMGRNYIEFIQVKIRTLSPISAKLIIHISIGLNAFINKEVVMMFLLEMAEMIYRKEDVEVKVVDSVVEGNQQEDEQDDDFKTVKGSDELVDFVEDDGLDDFQNCEQKQKQPQQKHNQPPNSQYLLAKHIDNPISGEKYHKHMKQHYLFHEWKRIKNGGVVCTNEAMITAQKNLFKQALSKMGKNILKGQILKQSMPVIIFKKESHLQSIAKDFCYAPIFFDGLAKQGGNALERVKYATLLAVSVGTLGISLEKPFNPILGETLQCRIDGCPMYLQQISHHPPVGAYYFQGRGYRIYGEIEPKISFGLNNIKGFSIRPNYLQFSDGTQIQMIYGKMIIKGLLFGDREFNFQDKIYTYDKTHNIFSQICYGRKTKKNPLDYISGKIYRLKQQFLHKFNKSSPRIYPTKQYIIQELSTFQGIWNQEVYFDNVLYANFSTNLPFDLVPEEFPLVSDSCFREDLIQLIKGDLGESQKEKDKIQDSQRRDFKLRVQGKGSGQKKLA